MSSQHANGVIISLTHWQAEFLKGWFDEGNVLRQDLLKVSASLTDVP